MKKPKERDPDILSGPAARVLRELDHHKGRAKAIGMGELFLVAWPERAWENRINDTRALRKLITDLRWHGWRILYTTRNTNPGYFLAQTDSEIADHIRKLKLSALKNLKMASILAEETLSNTIGQLQLDFGEEN